MKILGKQIRSIRVRMFITLGTIIMGIIALLILVNSIILEDYYLYTKTAVVKDLYNTVNHYYNDEDNDVDIETLVNKVASKNSFDILIQTPDNIIVFSSEKDLITIFKEMKILGWSRESYSRSLIYSQKNMTIDKMQDRNGVSYLLATCKLDNDYKMMTRIPLESIQESVKISNKVLLLIGLIAIGVSAVAASFVSKKFTAPITELRKITDKMSRLDFSLKYKPTRIDDEVDDLGRNINTLSQKLEITIKQLRANNIELEKDIEEKSRIDEMRTQFISDVSHELKTPIALIQGYAEGLIENVNTDEESRKFYSEVILDESSKMDKLVKSLLELTKLEYGDRQFNDTRFNIVELVNEVIRNCDVMIKEKDIIIEHDSDEKVEVCADQIYIEQIVRNYITNAIKNIAEINGKKVIKINYKYNKDKTKVRVKVFNTGDNIAEEELQRIWKRFYKIDTSRNREAGGTGIGLSLVKAIMDKYDNKYGVENKIDGVEFYFDINC